MVGTKNGLNKVVEPTIFRPYGLPTKGSCRFCWYLCPNGPTFEHWWKVGLACL